MTARWIEVLDKVTACPYFWNKSTGDVTWNRPSGCDIRAFRPSALLLAQREAKGEEAGGGGEANNGEPDVAVADTVLEEGGTGEHTDTKKAVRLGAGLKMSLGGPGVGAPSHAPRRSSALAAVDMEEGPEVPHNKSGRPVMLPKLGGDPARQGKADWRNPRLQALRKGTALAATTPADPTSVAPPAATASEIVTSGQGSKRKFIER